MSRHLRLATVGPGAEGQPGAQRPIRVLLADGHDAVRRTLRLLLGAEDGVEIVAEASDLGAVEREVVAHLPDVLVLDLRTPGGSSIETVRRLRSELPRIEIVVLTMDDSAACALQALAAGAIGFVLMDTADEDLTRAVKLAARGGEYVSARVGSCLEALRLAATRYEAS